MTTCAAHDVRWEFFRLSCVYSVIIDEKTGDFVLNNNEKSKQLNS